MSPLLLRVHSKALNVGEELQRETLPLQMGSGLYKLQGLKPYTWYEVKISYPASVCISWYLSIAAFSELASWEIPH